MPTIETARSWYSTADPVHGFDHVLRVYRLAEQLAIAEGADLEIVRAAVLLHDINGDQLASPNVQRADHHLDAAEFARCVLQEEGWPEEHISAVDHCIQAHRFRDQLVQPETLEARVVFDADKLDAIGAVGAARAISYAVLHGQPVYAPPSDQFLQTGKTEPGEAHSAYHEHLFKLRKIIDRLYTPSALAIARQRHRFLETFFEELRAEYEGE
jgi:uncharacterized protein